MPKFLLLFLFLLFLLPSTVFAAAPVEHLVQEPVFGGRAFVLEAGVGNSPTLLLVHGLGDLASDIWEGLIPELAADFHVLAVDLPGFGRSEKRNALYSPAAYAAYLRWVADRFAPGPLILVGHSLGGAIALRYAADYPAQLQRLVLVDVAGILHRNVITREVLDPELRQLWPQLPADPLGRLDEWVGALITRLPGLPLDLDQLLASELLRERFLGGDPTRIAAVALIQEDFSRPLRQISAPTVILWGGEDRITPLRTGVLLEAVLPQARLQVIPTAGHLPMADQPALFRLALRTALVSPPPVIVPPPPSERIGVCRGEVGLRFSGSYARLEITDCSDIRLTNVAARAVTID
ncbi:MAG: alpha/beta hydrolase, partial [Desulfuromonadales bacterium]|nr:alpha/beta hydrolase [Desulfuromonadales bacterium]